MQNGEEDSEKLLTRRLHRHIPVVLSAERII